MEISISFIGDKNKFNLLIHRYITMGGFACHLIYININGYWNISFIL